MVKNGSKQHSLHCSHASICSYWIKTTCFCVVSLENDLETLRDALLKTRLDPTPSKTKSPGTDFFFSLLHKNSTGYI